MYSKMDSSKINFRLWLLCFCCCSVNTEKYLDCGPNWAQSFCRIRNHTAANADELLHFSVYPKQNLSTVEKIIFDKQTVNQLTKKLLDHLPNLEEIRAKNCMLTKVDKDLFGRGKKLTNLKTLTLSKNQLTKLEDMMFARANEMESLYLVRNKIGVIESDAFRGLIKLSTLDLAHNYLKNLNYDIFPDSEQLYNLDFSNNHLQEVDFDIFAGNQRYQSIKLNHNNIGKVHVSDDNYNVGMLDLSYNSLLDISPLKKLKNIFSMKASHNYNSSLTDSTNFIEEQIAKQTLRYYNIFTKSPFNRRAETPETEKCSSPDIDSSLSKGLTEPTIWPWLAGLYTQNTRTPRFKCDATLISSRVALSSAVCVHNARTMMRPNKLLVQLGRSDSDNMLTHDIRKFILHPDFYSNEDNIREPDIALVVMKKPVTFSDNIKSICVSPLRSSINSMVGKSGVLVGWKRSSIDLLSKAIPKMNQIPVVSNKKCLHGYESDDKFCSSKMDSESSCDVAPGSGLILKSKRAWKLRAIVSLGLYDPLTKECNMDSSFVFTDLGQHSDWIHGMAKKQNPLPLVSELTDEITLIDEDFPFF